MSFVTRIAPTPSGYLHRGNAYNFLLTWLLARAHGGKIVLRIDDLDKGRTRSHYIESIFLDLAWMGIDWDFGPTSLLDVEAFSQYQRMQLYKDTLDSISSHVDVFGCTCTRKIVAQTSKDGQYPGTCRENTACDGKIWRLWTKNQQGCINGEYMKIDSSAVVLRNRLGLPSYMFACVVDDTHYDVDLIVRGSDLYASSIEQSYVREVLSIQKKPQHIHHSLILDKHGKKLSKSTKSLPLSALRADGMSIHQIYSDFAQWRGWKHKPQDMDSLLDLFQREDPLYGTLLNR